MTVFFFFFFFYYSTKTTTTNQPLMCRFRDREKAREKGAAAAAMTITVASCYDKACLFFSHFHSVPFLFIRRGGNVHSNNSRRRDGYKALDVIIARRGSRQSREPVERERSPKTIGPVFVCMGARRDILKY